MSLVGTGLGVTIVPSSVGSISIGEHVIYRPSSSGTMQMGADVVFRRGADDPAVINFLEIVRLDHA